MARSSFIATRRNRVETYRFASGTIATITPHRHFADEGFVSLTIATPCTTHDFGDFQCRAHAFDLVMDLLDV